MQDERASAEQPNNNETSQNNKYMNVIEFRKKPNFKNRDDLHI